MNNIQRKARNHTSCFDQFHALSAQFSMRNHSKDPAKSCRGNLGGRLAEHQSIKYTDFTEFVEYKNRQYIGINWV